MDLKEFVFKATFGHGQPNYPGHVRIPIVAESLQEGREIATARMNKKYKDRWCKLYNPDQMMFGLDECFRGEI